MSPILAVDNERGVALWARRNLVDTESHHHVAEQAGSIADLAQSVLGALNALLASLHLYGPEHAVTHGASATLSTLLSQGAPGWLRVQPDGFTDASGRRCAGQGLGDLARDLSAANVAAVGVFGPVEPAALVHSVQALARLVSGSGTIHEEAARVSAATGDALRIMPFSAGRVALERALAGEIAPVDWARVLDQLFDDVGAKLRAMAGEAPLEAAPVRGPNPMVAVGEAIAGAPEQQRSVVMRDLRDRLSSLTPEQRSGLLDLEPGKPDSHYQAMAHVVEAFPTAEVAGAIDGAVARSGTVSPHTVRILSKLIAVSRDDSQAQRSVRDLVGKARDRAKSASAPDPSVCAALETLLKAAESDQFNPEAYEHTLRSLIQSDTGATDHLRLGWESPTAQACVIAGAIAQGEDATEKDRAARVEFVRRRLVDLLQARAIDSIRGALESPGPAEGIAELHKDLLQPPSLRALAGVDAPSTSSLMRRLGVEAGASALLEAARSGSTSIAPRLARLAREAGDWANIVDAAAAQDPIALADALAPSAGLDDAQRDAVAARLLDLGRPEVVDKVMTVFLAHGLTWSAAAINHALVSPDNATVVSALPHLKARQDPACLPPLGEYLCGRTPARMSIRTYRLVARALVDSGEVGATALAMVSRVLATHGGLGALLRLFLLGQSMERLRATPAMRQLLRDRAVPRVRPIVILWTLVAWLREER